MSPIDPKRVLEREHRPRTLKAAGEIEPRPSRADERAFAEQAADEREQRRQEQRAELGRAVEHALRAIEHALRAIEHVRTLAAEIAPAEFRGALRVLDHHLRRVRGVVGGLVNPPSR